MTSPKDTRVAIIVLAYQLPDLASSLLASLRHPAVRLYLHVDSRTNANPFELSLAAAGLSEQVVFLPRHPSVWGSAQVVDAALEGLRAGLVDGCKYFLLISGQDLPLRPVEAIVSFAERAGETSFVEHWPIAHSRHRFQGRDRTDFYAFTVRGRRELCVPRSEDASFLSIKGRALNQALRVATLRRPRRGFPPYISPFAGATWWNISRPGAEYIVSFCDRHPDYRAYHEHTWVPEEIFFQSILCGTEYKDTFPVVSDNLRSYRWQGVRAEALRADDFDEIADSGKLFARKFDPRVDPVVIARILERVAGASPHLA
jgi:hypothetical protein